MKQRLVGAVVLIALAVIFLPMLLEGPVKHTRVDVPIEVPPQPDVTAESHLPRAGFADEPNPGGAVPENPPDADSATAGGNDEPVAGSTAKASGQPSAEVAQPETTAAGDATSASDADQGSSEPAVTESKPTDSAPAKAGDWAVQVGAFGKEENALALRNRLRKAGYDVYTDRTKGDDGDTIYRVRVGPLASRDKADGVARRILSALDIKGLVVPR